MFTRINCAKCVGLDAVHVSVETDIGRGIGIHLVGLADAAVRESLLRTTTALDTMGFHIPGKKIVINLAPADMHKSGSGYDLPIAIGIISASGQMDLPLTGSYLIMGELGLDGSVRPVPGALAVAELALRLGLAGIVLPERSAMEAVEIPGLHIYGVKNLRDAVRILEGRESCDDLDAVLRFRGTAPAVTDKTGTGPFRAKTVRAGSPGSAGGPNLTVSPDLAGSPDLTGMAARARTADHVDFSEIIGQEGAKRAMEIAAAGGHNIILIGSPGSGKTSLAKALPGILPPMSREESLVTSKVYSVAGRPQDTPGLIRERPFRAPHHSASMAAMIGGGIGGNIQPGEVSLATNGVLFLDEFGQIPQQLIEALRAPMEDRTVTISRLRGKVSFPASFMLVAASNPCPCGYYGEGDRCVCPPHRRSAYMARLSGPVMDRIDIQVLMHPVPPEKIVGASRPEASGAVALRVLKARERQAFRFAQAQAGISTNAEMSARLIERLCPLDADSRETLRRLMKSLGLSMRAYHRIIKVARTIADIEGCEHIDSRQITEAASFRLLDRGEV